MPAHIKTELRQHHHAFAGFASPTSNTTYCPNQFFDVCLPNRSRGCVRLVAYLLRKTLGWSDEQGKPMRERHRVTYQELSLRAGISREMIKDAVNEAIKENFITAVRLGRPNSSGQRADSSVYELKWDERAEYIKDPKRFGGFFAGEGNRTYIPNQFLDDVVPNEPLAVMKVVGSVIRFSIGFQTRWGHRRQLVSLSYRDIQRYSHLRDRKSLTSAIRTAMQLNYILRLEAGVFDPNAGRLSRPATYALKWLDSAVELPNGQKTPPAKQRSEIPTGNGQKTLPGERSENPTDIQITRRNNISKQQPDESAVAFEGLKSAGFDEKAARAIASRFEPDRIERQLRWIERRAVRSNRLGMLRVAIEQDWSAPSVPRMGSKKHSVPPMQPTPAEHGASYGESVEAARQRLFHSSSNPI
ncbi:MAG TPA: hypothetical protein VHS31_13005 [Tepidisphaeraceae bacterium]|nr:hypothetical protein [Tepidisphaeraceae bacterium]